VRACGQSADATVSVPVSHPHGPTVAALPFTIEGTMLSDLFQNHVKVARIGVGVDGCSAAQWAATSIAIAERVATFGVDSIEVSVRRSDKATACGV